MKTYRKDNTPPKKQGFSMGFDPKVREKAEAIANCEGVSLAEAVRRAILAYPLEQTEGIGSPT